GDAEERQAPEGGAFGTETPVDVVAQGSRVGGYAVVSTTVVQRILLTGMSGSGKSTALAELSRRGFDVVDTDEGGWTVWSEDAGGYVWREDCIDQLLARESASTLYVSGTVSNQGEFYDRFDAVVL